MSYFLSWKMLCSLFKDMIGSLYTTTSLNGRKLSDYLEEEEKTEKTSQKPTILKLKSNHQYSCTCWFGDKCMMIQVDSGRLAHFCDEKVPEIVVEAVFGHRWYSNRMGDLVVMLEINVIFEIRDVTVWPLISGMIVSTRQLETQEKIFEEAVLGAGLSSVPLHFIAIALQGWLGQEVVTLAAVV